MLSCRKYNQDQIPHCNELRIYESATVWSNQASEESEQLGLLIDAKNLQDATRFLRRIVEDIVNQIVGNIQVDIEVIADQHNHANIYLQHGSNSVKQHLGVIGIVDAKTKKYFDLQQDCAYVLLDERAIYSMNDFQQLQSFTDWSVFPHIEWDLSVICDQQTTWQNLVCLINQVDCGNLIEVKFLEVYCGKPIPANQKSISFRLLFNAQERTLQRTEVEEQVQCLLQALEKKAIYCRTEGVTANK